MKYMMPVVRILLVANIAVFVLQGLNPYVQYFGEFVPQLILIRPWTVITYMFVHGSITHILFNMLGLWMFGSELERVWGERRYLEFYFASLVAAALTQLVVTGLMGTGAPTVGASGALFGLLLAFAMMFPNRIILLFFVIPMRARWLVLLYGVLELYQGIYVMNSGVAHFAHLGGMIGAWLLLRYWRGVRRSSH